MKSYFKYMLAMASAVLLMLPAANVTIEVNNYTGSANSFTTLLANNTGGVLISDGYNVRANAVTGTQSVTLLTVNGGQAVTGTYTS